MHLPLSSIVVSPSDRSIDERSEPTYSHSDGLATHTVMSSNFTFALTGGLTKNALAVQCNKYILSLLTA